MEIKIAVKEKYLEGNDRNKNPGHTDQMKRKWTEINCMIQGSNF